MYTRLYHSVINKNKNAFLLEINFVQRIPCRTFLILILCDTICDTDSTIAIGYIGTM